jgi:formylglycine-generating enzyme required for sulfatase activity
MDGGFTKLWDVDAGRTIWTLPRPSGAGGRVAFSSLGRLAIGAGGQVLVHDFAPAKEQVTMWLAEEEAADRQAKAGTEPVRRTADGMVQIPLGEFLMGSCWGYDDECPLHSVDLSGFLMDEREVTQASFEELLGRNPSRRDWLNPDWPVAPVSWADAVAYCNARSLDEGLTPCYDLDTLECDFSADGYRLPTEAEWEYACRAGSPTVFPFGNDADELTDHAWTRGEAGAEPKPVGQKLPNAWGLHDMMGNAAEWCHDFYEWDYYERSPGVNPKGPQLGEARIVRGGSVIDSGTDPFRAATRWCADPVSARRLAKSPPAEKVVLPAVRDEPGTAAGSADSTEDGAEAPPGIDTLICPIGFRCVRKLPP